MFISLRESGATGFKKWSVSHEPVKVADKVTTIENCVVISSSSSDQSVREWHGSETAGER